MGSEGSSSDLHILFFPLTAHGHMLPMIDIAKLAAAAAGVRSTILITPGVALQVQPFVDHANAYLSAPIHLHLVPFPSGTAADSDNFFSLIAEDKRLTHLASISLLRQPFDRALEDLRPDFVVTDGYMPWTYDVAAGRGIPRVVFHGMNFFSQCVQHSLRRDHPPPADDSSVVVSGLPHRIELLCSQVPYFSKNTPPIFMEIFAQAAAADRKSLGVVVNSFYELEPEYADYYAKEMGLRAWHIGPVALCNREKAGTLSGEILRWLDGQKPGTVLYVCFGSLCLFSAVQLREITVGLEAAGHPFIWVLPNPSDSGGWMPAGYEERLKGRGLLVKEWAPQILILNHPAAGGFLTHCGWNSCLEGISAGLPAATWPLFAEQFFNERFLVDVLKVGVAVGAKEYAETRWERKEVVAAAAVQSAVRRLMGVGKEAEERRRRAKEAGGKARRAVEHGGSSYGELGRLIQELKEERDRRMMVAVGDG